MENNFRARVSFLSHLIICIIGVCAIGYIGAKYIFPVALPFIIAWTIALITAPVARIIGKKVGLPQRFIRTFLSLLIILSLLGGAVFLVIKLVGEAWQLLSGVSESAALSALLERLFDSAANIFGDSENASVLEEHLKNAAGTLIDSLLGTVGSLLSSFAASVPKFIIFLVITVISTVYFSIDLEIINGKVSRLLPRKVRLWCISFKNSSLKLALGYLRSYLLIMLITFSVVLLGLVFLRIRYALLLAIVIAILDLLPVLGVGSILIPWSIWNFLIGKTGLGIGLLVLFAAVELIRQFAEPKIVGKSLGIHPLVMLVLLYVGYSLLGFIGIILLPIFAVILNTLLEKINPSEVEKAGGGGGE